jgi:hypothetical protein
MAHNVLHEMIHALQGGKQTALSKRYQRTVSALAETRSLMAQIDTLIADHGGWPLK